MLLVIYKRIWSFLPTLFGVSVLAFLLIRLAPGDPVMLMVGERGASKEVYKEMRANLGLDKPLLTQYGIFLQNLVRGHFGESMVSKRPVTEEFFDLFPATFELSAASMFFAILLGIPCGLIAAVKRNKFQDYSIMGTSLIGYSMPVFWWGLVLIMFFSVKLGWTPVSGRLSDNLDFDAKTGFVFIDAFYNANTWEILKNGMHHMVLPVIVLGTIPLAAIARMTRSSLLEVLNEDFVRTARAKGVLEIRVILVHALRNALLPIVAIIGLMLGSVLTGAILTETIFSWPGLGRWLVTSIEARDYPVIQGGIVLIAISVMLVNLLVDLIYLWVNPLLRQTK